MKEWAKANQKVIIEPTHSPQFFLLKKGTTTVWTRKDQTSLLVPLFNGTMEVLVRVWGSDAEYRIEWNCGFVLQLDEETGIQPLAENLIFHYNLFRLQVGSATAGAADQEEEGVEGAGKTQGAV